MTAPARNRTAPASARTATRTTTAPATDEPSKPGRRTSGGTGSTRRTAAQRAYARRAHRTGTLVEGETPGVGRLALQHWPRSRATFVLVLMGLMLCGVVASLWLSTQAIADSYRLEQLREQNDQLAERAEQLRREVGRLNSPSSLAERAEALGMVPGGNPARLVVSEDGSVSVVGEPVAATAPPPPPEADEDRDADGDESEIGSADTGDTGDTGAESDADPESGTDGDGAEGAARR
ncbi:FtsB family cell division protein [Saccharomonospora piscinae]|uniref:FtsB family cell division protein n=1 Tax=Saccharomonospora piscinae TaxID=687388 RepID=UPI00046352E6|nr:hypothetical protein [Saccharomonospora piscinae]